jgi:predicted transcriptional regulator
MKNFLTGLACVVVFVGIIVFGYFMMFVDGNITAKYNSTVGVKVVNSQRDMYEHSTTFVEGRVQNLAKSRLELSKTKDVVARRAIVEFIVSDCTNLDSRDINDAGIRSFLEQARSGQLIDGGIK